MLAERATGSEVIAALATHGVSLNHENVSNWKHGGFQDWLIEQEWQAEVSVQREYPTGLDPDLPRPETRSFNNDAYTPFSASRSFLKSAWSKLRLFTIAGEELEQIASYVKIR